jgi:membrane associated rhomboid family serine protease
MKAHSSSHYRAALTVLLVLGFLSASCCNGAVSATTTPVFGVVPTTGFSQQRRALLDVRGGAIKKKSRTGSLNKTVTGKKKVGAAKKAAEKKSSSGNGLSDWYNNIPRLTKIYVNAILICTTVGLIIGEERAQAVLALDPMRLMYGLELWRPFTAASFLGKPSINWLMSGYYLYEYGSSLERAYGAAEYLVFLATQISLLTVFSSLLGIPFFTQSVITGMLHVLSRAMPHQKVKWLVITVPYWTLPYGLMISDCLQAKSPAAAMPHILGILAGHFYHFNRFVWPKSGGEDWLRAPDFWVDSLDPNAANKNAAKDSIKKALKRKRGKGKKLGSAV